MSSVAPKIKICGLTSLGDARAAAEAGAAYLGFIINVPKSPRNMAVSAVKDIVAAMKKEFPEKRFVGVFVDEDMGTLKSIVSAIGLDIVQLHGSESTAYCQSLRSVAEMWKSIIVKTTEDVAMAEKYQSSVDRVLFDAGSGSGQQFDYSLLSGHPVDILAGGLNSDNVREAILLLSPQIVDFNSGVESAPGKKDAQKIRTAVAAIKN